MQGYVVFLILGWEKQKNKMINCQDFGLRFNPFSYLDSTQDVHLYEYFVIPKTVEIAWGDAPCAIFAQPGGGKSALRAYTEKIYQGTRGVKLPIAYVPATYSPEPDFHFTGLKTALARSILIYLISYPDLFLQFSKKEQEKAAQLLFYLPYDLDFLFNFIQKAASINEIERLLGVGAISGIQKPGLAHQEMLKTIGSIQIRQEKDISVLDLLAQAREVFNITSFHILTDGLDGFIETTSKAALLRWIAPLFSQAEAWARQNIYLKFFFPLILTDFPEIHAIPGIQTAALEWDNGLLAEVIRRRLYVASGGAFDSLDAHSVPGLRNVEFQLARQLDAEHKLPREMILSVRHLLETVSLYEDRYIHDTDVIAREGNYA